jgi:tetratricopeptide (TPR) repeat protein
MAQKINRRDLKRNDLADTLGKTAGYVSAHKRGVTEAVVIGVGVAILAGAVVGYRLWTGRSAGRSLSQALSILDTPLPGEQPETPSKYSTASQRRAAAEPLLKSAAKHGSTAAGKAAEVVLAAVDADKPNAAVDVFEKAARQGRSETAAAAELDAARLLASQGKTTEAIERLKRAIESPSSAAPKDALLFTLGQIYEQTGASVDARAVYQRLINDYPNSPYRADARQKVPLS